MTADVSTLSRRTALGLALASAAAGAATAAEASADMKTVDGFLALWSAAEATGAALAAFMAEDGEFRYERKAPVTGRAALTAAFDGYLAGGKRYRMEPLETHVRGPVVFHYRHETALTNGTPGHTETLAGVFVLKGGKIAMWENFLVEA